MQPSSTNNQEERQHILDVVKETLVDRLGVDEYKVTTYAGLRTDLGAESIDYLDIIFTLENTLGFLMPRGSIIPGDITHNSDFIERVEGNKYYLNKKGINYLKTNYAGLIEGASAEIQQQLEKQGMITPDFYEDMTVLSLALQILKVKQEQTTN